MAPILVTREDGRDILVVGQKSGMVWALDPDAEGEVLWSARVGKGSALGGIHWGMASDGYLAYAANADRDAVIVDVHPDKEATPGLFALDLMTGDIVWSAPAPRDTCEERQGCYPANSLPRRLFLVPYSLEVWMATSVLILRTTDKSYGILIPFRNSKQAMASSEKVAPSMGPGRSLRMVLYS
ncbi:MAG: hypothetical protein CM1200mP14_27730 [Gammaproteobacteria bacterium]|nr:MAG: hypothetical protein CM1200mP14_27730 [Gammaproteobacteria bacterium]